ncbi:hypothetical protein CSUI_000481, partial [Cystoisospora suis]
AEKEEEEGQEERGEEEIQRQEKKEKQSESSDRYFFQTLLRLVQEGRFLVRDFLQQQPQRFHKERKKDEENSNLNRRRRSNSHDHREQERDECFLDHEVYIHPRDGKKTFLTGLYDHDGANGFTSSTSSILSSLSETSTSFSSHKEVDTERPEISFESSDNLLKDEKEIFDTTSTSCRFRGERDAFSWSLPSLRNRKEKLALQDLLHPLPPLLPQELREIAMSLFDSGVHTPQVEKIVYQHLQPYTYQTPSTLHVDRPLQQEPSVSAEEIFQPKTAFQDHEMQGKKVDEEEDKEKKQMRREGEEEEDAEEEEEEEKEKRKKERHLSPCHTDNFDEEKQAKEEEEEEEIFWSRLFLRKYAEEGQWYRAFDKLRKSVNLVTPHLQDLSYRRIPFKTQVNEDEEERSLSTEKEMKKKIEDGDGGREESRPGKESFDQAGAFLLFEEIKTEMNLKEEKEEAKRYEVKERKELENKKKDHEDDKEFKNEKREHEEGRMARRREILERIYKDISLVMSVCIEKEQYVKAAEALALLPSFERNVFPSLFPSFFLPDDHSLPSLSSSTSDDSSSSSPSYPSLLSMTVEACYRLFEMLEERKMKNKIKTSLLHEKKNVFSKTDIHPFRASVQDSIKASSSLSLPSLSSEEVEVREEISPMLDGNGLFSQECSSRLCLRDRERNGLHPVSSPQQDLSEMIVAHAARFLLFQLQSWQGEVHRSIKLLELEEDHDKEDEREGREGIQKGKEISKIDDRKEVCERLSPSRSLCSGVHTDERFDRMKERKKKFLKISLQYLQKQISLLKERLDHIELETSLDLLPERGRRAEKKGSSPFATFPVQESDKQEKTAAGKEQRDQDRQERELTKRKEDGEMTKREKESENEEEETVSPSLSVPSIDRRDILSSYVEGQRRKSMIDVYKEKKRKEFDLRVKNLDEVLKLLEEGERSLLSPLHYHHEEKGKTVSIHHEHPRSLLRRIRQCQDLKSILPLIRLYLSSSASSLGLSRRSTSNSKKEEDEEEREGMGDEITRKRSRRRRRRESEDAVEQDKVVQLHHIMVELLRVLHEENGTLSSSACRSSRLIDGEDQGGVYEKGGQEEEQDRSSKIARGQEEKKNHKEKEGKDCSMVAKDAFLKIFDQLLLSLLPPADRKHPSPSFSSSLQAKADRSLHSPSPHQKSVYTPQHHISYSYISTAISLALWNDFRRLQHFLSSLSSSSSTSSAHLSHQTSPSSFPLHLLPSIAGITALLFQLINPRRDPSTSVKAEEEERRKKNEERLLMHAISLIEKTSPELLHLSLEHQQSLPQPLQFLLAHIKSLQRKRKEEEERARQMSSSSSSDDKRHPSIMKFTRQTLIDEPSLHAQNKSLSASSHISPSIQLSPISSFSSDTEDHRSSSSSPPGLNLSVISPFSSSIYEEVEDTPALHAAKSAISSLYVKGPEEIVKEILEALKKRKFARGGKEDSKVFSKILELVLLVRCETTRLMKIVQKNTQEETEGQAEGESKQTDEARRRRGGHARSSSIHPVLWRERKRIIRLYT